MACSQLNYSLPGIQLSRAERLLQVPPGRVDEFGVAPDLVYLDLRAVAAHVGLLNHLVEGGVFIYAVDDVPEYLLLPLGPARVATEEELPKDRMILRHRFSSSMLRSSTKTSSHSPLLVEMSEWTERTSDPVCFSTMPSRTGRPASRTCWRMALMSLRPSKLLASCFSAGVNTPKLRTTTRSSTMRVRIRSGPRPTNSCWKAIISSLMAASVLLCLRFMDVSLHLLICAVQQRREPVLHRTSTSIEGTQSPALDPLATPRWFPEEAAEM